MYCKNCGLEIDNNSVACPKCGYPVGGSRTPLSQVSQKKRLVALLLCFFLGCLGVHRFYVGKIGTGVIMFLTFGGLGIWALIDFIVIAVCSFKDSEGKVVEIW